MEATFCLSRHLCTKPIFTTSCSRPTIIHFHVDLSYHRHCSLRGRTLQSWPTQKAQRKTLAVNSLPVPKDKNGGDGEGKSTKLVRTTVVLACVLGAICMSGMVGPRAAASIQLWKASQKVEETTHQKDNGMNPSEQTPGMLEKSLKALLDAQRPELLKADDQAQELEKLLQDQRPDPYELQEVVQKLRMTDKAQTVVEELQKQYDNSRNDNAHSLGLILVEMLIYQGEYKKAIRLLEEDHVGAPSADKGGPNSNNIQGSPVSDARRELFLAAAYLMVAIEKWTRFQEKVENMPEPERPPCNITSFEDFNLRIKELRGNIEAARTKAGEKKAK